MNIKALYSFFIKYYTISIDSRKIKKDSIFFGIKGNNFDGNDFVLEAIKKGAKYAVSNNYLLTNKIANIFYFEDPLKTLQDLATYHRKKINPKIIAITGSNGKTTTKNLFNNVLSQKFRTIATRGNLNNHIGVPLTLLSIKKKTEVAIIEMGANQFNDIQELSEIAQPDIGIITNFGEAHLEKFGSKEGIIKGKSELYNFLKEKEREIIINIDDNKQVKLLKEYPYYSYGTRKNANVILKKYSLINDRVVIGLENIKIETQLKGDFNFYNVAAAIAIGKFFSITNEQIKKGIENYIPKENRGETLYKNTNKIFLDAYNANPSSMKESLKFFFKINTKKNKILILGDMLELGKYAIEKHREIIDFIEKNNFEKAFLVGDIFSKIKVNQNNIFLFKEKKEIESYLREENLKNKYFFIKASNSMMLNTIVKFL